MHNTAQAVQFFLKMIHKRSKSIGQHIDNQTFYMTHTLFQISVFCRDISLPNRSVKANIFRGIKFTFIKIKGFDMFVQNLLICHYVCSPNPPITAPPPPHPPIIPHSSHITTLILTPYSAPSSTTPPPNPSPSYGLVKLRIHFNPLKHCIFKS